MFVVNPKSLEKTYLIAIACTLVPAWIAGAVMSNSDAMEFSLSDLRTLSVLFLYTIALWGSSIAHIYIRQVKYALFSGFGKLALIGISFAVDYSPTPVDNGHPYLIVCAVMFLMLWGALDFVLLFFGYRKYEKFISQ